MVCWGQAFNFVVYRCQRIKSIGTRKKDGDRKLFLLRVNILHVLCFSCPVCSSDIIHFWGHNISWYFKKQHFSWVLKLVDLGIHDFIVCLWSIEIICSIWTAVLGVVSVVVCLQNSQRNQNRASTALRWRENCFF